MVMKNKRQKDKSFKYTFSKNKKDWAKKSQGFFASSLFSKNKKGWTEILEVFVSILLLAALVTIILDKGVVQEETKSEDIYKEQALALKIIQLNNSLRDSIFASNLGEVPLDVNNTIQHTISNYLECKAIICVLNSKCNLDPTPEKKEIYVKSIAIFVNNTDYNPKELKLFCWEK